MNNNIILIGMPGCGKSTVGVVLAKAINYQFLDSDLMIQSQENRLLHDILDQEGLAGFRAIENQVNASIQCTRTIIATGGSVVYGKEAMAHLRTLGRVIYLQLPLEEVQTRLGDLHQRGVAIAPNQTLADLYQERAPLYERYAHHVVPAQGLAIPQVVQAVKVLCGL